MSTLESSLRENHASSVSTETEWLVLLVGGVFAPRWHGECAGTGTDRYTNVPALVSFRARARFGGRWKGHRFQAHPRGTSSHGSARHTAFNGLTLTTVF